MKIAKALLLGLLLPNLAFASRSTFQELDDGFFPSGKIQISVVSIQKATQLINMFRSDPRLNFDYGSNGCIERAQLMTSTAAKMKLELGKVFVTGQLYADNSASKLKAQMPNDVYDWKKHVAPVIFIEQSGSVQPMILDPALSLEPMTILQFRKKITSKGLPSFADGTLKEDPFIEQLYYGSRFQYDFFHKYPAKIPAMDMKDFDRIAQRNLQLIDQPDVPGMSSDFVMTEEAYCQKYGLFCADREAEKKIRRRLEQEAAAYDVEPQQCEPSEILKLSKSSASIPDGYSKDGRIELSILTESKATELFNRMKANSKIKFQETARSYFRAHLMVETAAEMNLIAGKVLIEGILLSESAKRFSEKVDQTFRLYVAPIVVVEKTDRSLVKKVLDPNFFDGPVELDKLIKTLQVPSDSKELTPKVNRIYCGDRYQLNAYTDAKVKFPPHDMKNIYEILIQPDYDQIEVSSLKKSENKIKKRSPAKTLKK